ncbi:tyrosine-type recombinase/integrase [Photobacterium chitinilyticum]|uniref:Site-specific integrase n=1 Tax=Photobacterium chitinilyticum TaxID=2485123 RepID=A0A444JIG8_9GAMM|nr:tyrosine-type recombinase/integrase [Photobacterium chitinilyticum]RWX52855.1 site-specific integrase [Photobacterium chitinilyticum]
MPRVKILETDDVQELVNQNSAPPNGKRDCCLIMSALLWGLTMSEMSLLSLEDVMGKHGVFYRIWTLPASIAYNGIARELRTEDHLLMFLEPYMDWVVKHKFQRSNLHTYRQRKPESPFFLNDSGEGYAMSPRVKGGSDYQPRSMNDKFRKMVAKTSLQGVTPTTFRDSWVKAMYEAGCGYSDLQAVSGIRSKATLSKKVKPTERDLEAVFKTVYNRVKFPKG